MKVVIYPADDGACGQYRMLYPAAAMQAAGYDVVVAEDNSPVKDGLANQDANGEWTIHAGQIPDADVVVIQRPSAVKGPSIMRYLKSQGVRTVVELDDNFHALTSRNRAWYAYQKFAQEKGSGMSIAALSKSVALADRVVVSTPALAKTYSTDVVMRNCIPESFLSTFKDVVPRTLGWSGSMAVHGGDLEVVGIGVRQALDHTGWDFRVVGEGQGVDEELGLEGRVPDTGWLPMNAYLMQVASLAAAIAPLADDQFNRSKSWLKSLEYAALGVPHVTSDLPEYRALGAGLVAGKPKQWRSALLKIMTDEQFREDLIIEGRKIAERYTYEQFAHEWWRAWTE